MVVKKKKKLHPASANAGRAAATRGQRGGLDAEEADEYDEYGEGGDEQGEEEEADDDELDPDRGHNPDGSLKNPRAWRIHLAHVKSGMGLNKNCVQWSFVHRGDMHVIELAHSTFGGKRTIRVDGIVKVTEKKVIDNGSKYHLEALGSTKKGNVMVIVEIKPVGVSGVTYELYIDGRDYDHAKRYWLHQDD